MEIYIVFDFYYDGDENQVYNYQSAFANRIDAEIFIHKYYDGKIYDVLKSERNTLYIEEPNGGEVNLYLFNNQFAVGIYMDKLLLEDGGFIELNNIKTVEDLNKCESYLLSYNPPIFRNFLNEFIEEQNEK